MKQQVKRVLFVPAGGLGNASARTRFYYHLPRLAALGIQAHIASVTWHKYDAPGARSAYRTLPGWLAVKLLPLRNLVALFRADVLWFQKKSIWPLRMRIARWFGKRIVYDFDDALHLVPPPAESGMAPHDLQTDTVFLPRLKRMLRIADEVVVSGAELARFAAQYARRVRILPTVVDGVADAPAPGGLDPVIGWVGAPENQRYLREIEQVLMRLQDDYPELEVWILTSQLMDPPPRFRYRFLPWSFEAERELIPQFTVGIAPLVDDAWCRAKINYKALVYLSHGVPAVVTPVGFPVDEFEDGRSVMLARTPDEWYSRLNEVLVDRARRDELAAGGLEVVRRRFTAAGRVADFAAALREQR